MKSHSDGFGVYDGVLVLEWGEAEGGMLWGWGRGRWGGVGMWGVWMGISLWWGLDFVWRIVWIICFVNEKRFHYNTFSRPSSPIPPSLPSSLPPFLPSPSIECFPHHRSTDHPHDKKPIEHPQHPTLLTPFSTLPTPKPRLLNQTSAFICRFFLRCFSDWSFFLRKGKSGEMVWVCGLNVRLDDDDVVFGLGLWCFFQLWGVAGWTRKGAKLAVLRLFWVWGEWWENDGRSDGGCFGRRVEAWKWKVWWVVSGEWRWGELPYEWWRIAIVKRLPKIVKSLESIPLGKPFPFVSFPFLYYFPSISKEIIVQPFSPSALYPLSKSIVRCNYLFSHQAHFDKLWQKGTIRCWSSASIEWLAIFLITLLYETIRTWYHPPKPKAFVACKGSQDLFPL